MWSVGRRVNELTIGADRRTHPFALDHAISRELRSWQLGHAEAHAAFGVRCKLLPYMDVMDPPRRLRRSAMWLNRNRRTDRADARLHVGELARSLLPR